MGSNMDIGWLRILPRLYFNPFIIVFGGLLGGVDEGFVKVENDGFFVYDRIGVYRHIVVSWGGSRAS